MKTWVAWIPHSRSSLGGVAFAKSLAAESAKEAAIKFAKKTEGLGECAEVAVAERNGQNGIFIILVSKSYEAEVLQW